MLAANAFDGTLGYDFFGCLFAIRIVLIDLSTRLRPLIEVEHAIKLGKVLALF